MKGAGPIIDAYLEKCNVSTKVAVLSHNICMQKGLHHVVLIYIMSFIFQCMPVMTNIFIELVNISIAKSHLHLESHDIVAIKHCCDVIHKCCVY